MCCDIALWIGCIVLEVVNLVISFPWGISFDDMPQGNVGRFNDLFERGQHR